MMIIKNDSLLIFYFIFNYNQLNTVDHPYSFIVLHLNICIDHISSLHCFIYNFFNFEVLWVLSCDTITVCLFKFVVKANNNH